MPIAPLPLDEQDRLAAVRSLRLMGMPASERFDKITRLAQRTFNVPVAIIDLLGEDRIWLLSAQGFDGMEAVRQLSYCQYSILHDDICLVSDALTDPRVFDNPSAATYRFYAGHPVYFRDHRVGVLCIADHGPREFTKADLGYLRDLASMVEQEFMVQALTEVQIGLAEENERLRMVSRVDVLTRVWNRGAVEEIIGRQLALGRRTNISTGVILMDLDHFKQINDEHGHLAGDEVLREVSSRLRKTVRASDAVGRWGGEEFMVVLAATSVELVVAAAERIREAICAEPVEWNGRQIPVTASFGCSLSGDSAQSIHHLVKAADDALYRAKAGGRNQTQVKLVSPSIMAMAAVKRRDSCIPPGMAITTTETTTTTTTPNQPQPAPGPQAPAQPDQPKPAQPKK